MPRSMSRTRVALPAALVIASVLALAVLLYFLPPDFSGPIGLDPDGASLYRTLMHESAGAVSISAGAFTWIFRAILVVAWIGWLALLREVSRSSAHPRIPVFGLASIYAGLALAAPPVLSHDVWGYVAYGQLAFHGLNPYTSGRSALEAIGDPAAAYLVWPVTLPYGPLWTMIAAAIAWVSAPGGLVIAMVVHRLVAAASLLTMAIAGGRVAEARSRGWGAVTSYAIAFNPLLLMEGPVSGHNDFLAVALLVLAAVVTIRRHSRAACVLVGLAIAVKATAAALLPLVVYNVWIDAERSEPAGKKVLIAASLTVLPPLVLSAVFGPMAVAAGVLSQANAVRPAGALWLRLAVVFAAYAWGLRFIGREGRGSPTAWLTAGVVVSGAALLANTSLLFPWYAAWFLAPALTGWDERHRVLVAGSSVIGFLLSWLYTLRA